MTPLKLRTVLLLALALLVVAAAGWFSRSRFVSPGTDRLLAELRTAPLIGQVIADEPSVEQRLRQAIDDDRSDPLPGRSRPFEAIVDIRKTYIVPALQKASDAAALTVMTRRLALASHLQRRDVAGCRQFASGGLRDVARLDSEGQRLFTDVLSAMDAAYRSGREAGATARPAMTDQDYAAALREAGFGDDDLRKLADATALSDAEVCALEVRIDGAVANIAEGRRGAFARHVLAR